MPLAQLLCSTTFFIPWCLCLAVGQKPVEPTCCRWKPLKPWANSNLVSLELLLSGTVHKWKKGQLTQWQTKTSYSVHLPFLSPFTKVEVIYYNLSLSGFITYFSKLWERIEYTSSICYSKKHNCLLLYDNHYSVLRIDLGIIYHTILRKLFFTSGGKCPITLVESSVFPFLYPPRVLSCENET